MLDTVRRLLPMAALASLLLCGCEEAGQARSLDADIERTRLQIAAKRDERQRLDAEFQKLDKLVAEHEKLQGDLRRLRAERASLLAQLRAPAAQVSPLPLPFRGWFEDVPASAAAGGGR